MSWRIKQFFRQHGKLALIGVLVFTAYAHVTGGGGGVGRFMRTSTRWIYDVPVAGSFLRQGRNFTRNSYLSYSKGSSKKYSKGGKARRGKHGRRSRRGRRR